MKAHSPTLLIPHTDFPYRYNSTYMLKTSGTNKHRSTHQCYTPRYADFTTKALFSKLGAIIKMANSIKRDLSLSSVNTATFSNCSIKF